MSIDARKIRLLMKLRRNGITDTAVLGAIERVPREIFVPEAFHDQAYEDMALPIGLGQTISQPTVVAAMTQALEIHSRMKVLEIGTGSGYQASVLSRLCRRVYSIERHKPLLEVAEQRFRQMRLHNVTTKCADGMKGWAEQAPFDRIIVTAAALRDPPEPLLQQLSPEGGILIIPMGSDTTDQFIYRITRTDGEAFGIEKLFPVRFVPLLPNVPGNTRRDEQAPIDHFIAQVQPAS